MKVAVLSPVVLPSISCAKGGAASVVGGWVQAMVDGLLSLQAHIEVLAICFGNDDFFISEGSIRYQMLRGHPDDPGMCLRVSDCLSRFGADVVLAQGTERGYAGYDDAAYGNRPVVVSLQGIISGLHPHADGLISREEARGTRLNLKGILKGRSIYQIQRRWRDADAPREAAIFRKRRYFIGRTAWDEAWVRFYNPKARYFHVEETMRSPFYGVSREESRVKKHTIYCGASAAYPLKGMHWLILACAALKGDFPDIQIRVAAANGKFDKRRSLRGFLYEDAYTRYLRRVICKAGMGDHVVGLPTLSAQDVVAELKTADIYVLPSLCENSPNSLCEAMLCGVPAIATYGGGMPSILGPGTCGTLVAPADPAALANAIRTYFEHPELARHYAECAREIAVKRHDARANAKALLAVLEDVVAESKEAGDATH